MHLFRAARPRAIRVPVRPRDEPDRQRAGAWPRRRWVWHGGLLIVLG